MVNVINEIVINLPKEKVSAFVSDPANAPHWCTHIRSVEFSKGMPLRAGTQLVINEQVMHRYQQHTYEVVEFIAGQKMVMRTESNGMMLETTFGWQAVDENRTCMRLRHRARPAGISKAITPLFALSISSYSRRNLKYLKRLLEYSVRKMIVL
ncbi:hypothetical protein A3860_12265 [Niastella vici]|uniref:Polyketide cyclase n=1 Tax=Niastella vici TaxID=1703345 RepID=A0A1V9G6T5_9BACT|nr:SRPBCC family protein [Niastella vici]OQP66272.1 hypothetical protein A3860_12265 [Niastella vici]